MGGFIVLQDWITIGGRNSTDEVTQSQTDYVDAADYSDMIVHAQVKDLSGGIDILVQTAPITDESMWYTVATITATGITRARVLHNTGNTPLARYVRWKLSGATTGWEITFRVMLNFKQD